MFEVVDLPDRATLARFAERYPVLEVAALEGWLHLMRTSGDFQDDLDQFLARYGLTQRKFFSLILLLRNPQGLNVSRLAWGTGVSCATMTGVVEGMVAAGLVARAVDDADRRAFVLTITAAGVALLDQVLPNHYRRVSGMFAPLDDAERQQLATLLEKLSSGLEIVREADPA